MGEVGLFADNEIIDNTHAIAALKQQIHHVTADKPGSAGNHCGLAWSAHFAPVFFMVRTSGYQSSSKPFVHRLLHVQPRVVK